MIEYLSNNFASNELIVVCISYDRYQLELQQSERSKNSSQCLNFTLVFKMLSRDYSPNVPYNCGFRSIFITLLAALKSRSKYTGSNSIYFRLQYSKCDRNLSISEKFCKYNFFFEKLYSTQKNRIIIFKKLLNELFL